MFYIFENTSVFCRVDRVFVYICIIVEEESEKVQRIEGCECCLVKFVSLSLSLFSVAGYSLTSNRIRLT